jgi:hypothetical protein
MRPLPVPAALDYHTERRASVVRLPEEPRDPRGGWFSLILRVVVTALLLAIVVALLIAILASR